jgi:hypothetical protein
MGQKMVETKNGATKVSSVTYRQHGVHGLISSKLMPTPTGCSLSHIVKWQFLFTCGILSLGLRSIGWVKNLPSIIPKNGRVRAYAPSSVYSLTRTLTSVRTCARPSVSVSVSLSVCVSLSLSLYTHTKKRAISLQA